MNATRIQRVYFSSSHPIKLELASAARISRTRERTARTDRYQSLSCNRARDKDARLHPRRARVRNGERYCRRGRNEERCRDEWRIESDVVVRARKDIIAEKGTRSNVW